MLTIATRSDVEIASVTNLGIRCAVFARKKFLRLPLYMSYKLAFSNLCSTYHRSTVPQFRFEQSKVTINCVTMDASSVRVVKLSMHY